MICVCTKRSVRIPLSLRTGCHLADVAGARRLVWQQRQLSEDVRASGSNDEFVSVGARKLSVTEERRGGAPFFVQSFLGVQKRLAGVGDGIPIL